MTKRITLLFAIFAVILSFYFPEKFSKNIKECGYVIKQEQKYANAVYGNGFIVEKEYNEVYLECPVVAGIVNVNIGEYVNKGDVIATVDTKVTQSVLSSALNVSKANDIISQIPIDTIMEKAKDFGIDLDFLAKNALNQNITSVTNASNNDVIIPENIVSPIDGVITDLNIKSGVLLNSDKPAVRVSNVENLVAEVYVSENDINKVTVGAKTIIEPTATNFKAYTGTVSYIYPVADNKSDFAMGSQVKVIIDIDNIDNNLKPNFTANAKIYVSDEKSINTLPYEAILQDVNNKEYVYVYNKGKAKKVYITTGTELTECTEVMGNLTEDDCVLINTNDIKDGDYIKLKGE